MQPWQAVKVTADGQYKGRAGVILRVADGVHTVKLDALAATAQSEAVAEANVNFTEAELQPLG